MPDQTRNLNSVTDFAGTLDSNDRIIMTDNKASLKALTTAILGKTMIEGYTGSSLGGASQSVKSAIDTLNSNTYLFNGAKRIPNGTDVNTMITPGTYQIQMVTDAETMPNIPFITAGIFIVEKSGYASSNYFRQTFKQFNSGDVWSRYTIDGGRTWTDWRRNPDRFEMDALNSKISGFYMKKLDSEANNSVSFTLSGRGTVLAISNDSGGRSWIAVIGVSNTASLNNLTILKHDSDPNYDPTCSFSEKTVTLNIHPWENIVCISTVPFS